MSLPDKYEIVRQLGVGGMGEVFLAKVRGVPGFEKQVVVKRLLPHLGKKPEIAALFLQEARLVSQMSHANVVQVFDAGQTDGELWLVMEYVNGPNLLQVIRRARERGVRVPIGVACRIMADVCAGLAYAHALTGSDGRPLGLVHRDLSPDNILLDRTGQAKVTDFGIAKVKDSEVQTQPGWTRGKYRYMAPEQLLGKGELTQQADLFVVGVVFAELLTGRHPFTDDAGALAPARVCAGDYPPLASLRPELSKELELLLRRALAPEPEDRFPTGKAMRAAIEQALRGQETNQDDVAEFLEALVSEEPFTPPKHPELQAHSAETVRDLGRVSDSGSPVSPQPVGTADLIVSKDAPVVTDRVVSGPARHRPLGWVVAIGLALGFALTIAVVSARKKPEPEPLVTRVIDAGASEPAVLPDAGSAIVELIAQPDAGELDAGVSEAVRTKVRTPVRTMGQVELRVRPPATVYVDGVSMGESPLPILKLPVGPHRFRFVNDETDQVKIFDVKPGSQRIGVTLP